MKTEFINPPGIFKHPAFSAVVTVEEPRRFHFIAGRCATDENYRCIAPGNMLAQYRRVMELLDLELKSIGATWHDVVHRRVYVLDVDEFLKVVMDPEANAYWEGRELPASTLIGVTRLSDPEFLIEIDLVAVTG
jgi:enamine deaminase RidA (YjgF/YER057c/UK114 family)